MNSILPDLGIIEVAAGYRARQFSPVEVVSAVLERIVATDPIIHAWVVVAAEEALAAAAAATREQRDGVDRGPLHGAPIAVKDIFDVAGLPTQCGSRSRDDALPAMRDASAVASLRAAGAIVLGKTVAQEFAAGVLSAPARNPWDAARAPGGSSGGSAAAMAAGAGYGALGSDTGGSIRIPAAACGVTGFKPVFAEIATDGVFPLSWSLDTVGPLARGVQDTWIMWRALLGDRETNTELLAPGAGRALDGVRIGVSRSYFFEWLQPDVLATVEKAIEALRSLGAGIIEAPWPEAAAARACAFIINRVETAAVHERIAIGDPQRFQRYGPELRLRIAAGRQIPASTYVEALRSRNVIRDGMAAMFTDHALDAMLVPTLPTTAISAAAPEITGTGREESIGAGWTRLTMPFNATGQPVLAMPCGLARDGLPVGIQLAGRPGDERLLFRIGAALESALGGVLRPPLLKLTNSLTVGDTNAE